MTKLTPELKVFKEGNEATLGIDKAEMESLKNLRKFLNPSRDEAGTTTSTDKFKTPAVESQVDRIKKALDVTDEKGLRREFKDHLSDGIGEALMMQSSGQKIEINEGGVMKTYDVYEYYKDIMMQLYGQALDKSQLIQRYESKFADHMNTLGGKLASLTGTDNATINSRKAIIDHAFSLGGHYFERRRYIFGPKGTFQSNAAYPNDKNILKPLIDSKNINKEPYSSFSELYKNIIDLQSGVITDKTQIDAIVNRLISNADTAAGQDMFIKFRTFNATEKFRTEISKTNTKLEDKMNILYSYAGMLEYVSDLEGLYTYKKDANGKFQRDANNNLVPDKTMKESVKEILETLHEDFHDVNKTKELKGKKETYQRHLEDLIGQINSQSDAFGIQRKEFLRDNILKGVNFGQSDLERAAANGAGHVEGSFYLEGIGEARVLTTQMLQDISKFYPGPALNLEKCCRIENLESFVNCFDGKRIKELHMNLDLFALNDEQFIKLLNKLPDIGAKGVKIVVDAKTLTPNQIRALNGNGVRYQLSYNTEAINYSQFMALAEHKGSLALPQLEQIPSGQNISTGKQDISSSEQALKDFCEKRISANGKTAVSTLELGVPKLMQFHGQFLTETFKNTNTTIKLPNLRNIEQGAFGRITTALKAKDESLRIELPALQDETAFTELFDAQASKNNDIMIGAIELNAQQIKTLEGVHARRVGLGVSKMTDELVKALVKNEHWGELNCFKVNKLDGKMLKELIASRVNNAFFRFDNVTSLDDSHVDALKAKNHLTKIYFDKVDKINDTLLKKLLLVDGITLKLGGLKEIEPTNEKMTSQGIETFLNAILSRKLGSIALGNIQKIPVAGEKGVFIDESNIATATYKPYIKGIFQNIQDYQKAGRGTITLQGFLGRYYNAFEAGAF